MRKIKDFGGKIWNTKAETIISLKARLKKMFLYIYIKQFFKIICTYIGLVDVYFISVD